MSRICPLFSGSKANCTYISVDGGSFLVDMGCSYKSFLLALEKIGGDLSEIRGIFITHEHYDHIAGLKTFLKNNNIPLFASNETLHALARIDSLPSRCDAIGLDGTEIEIGSTVVSRFATSHDCIGSSGYSFTAQNGAKVSVCTDTGILTEDTVNNLLGSNICLIESNHDITMLKNGIYPPYLKARILSDKGHLSNTTCAEFLPRLLESGTNRFILGHLSQNNNTPLLALNTAKTSLAVKGAKINSDYLLSTANPNNNEVIPF
ncbi:MAG: MBL fold metallo-hydrolase [Clostridia bacterium]|nr:MBL fold metallo-hydrolase [Clostridia bacterium]